MNDHLRLCRRRVGHGVVVGAAHDPDIAGSQLDGFVVVVAHPGAAAQHGSDRERRLVADAQRPRRVEHRTKQERAPGTRSVQEADKRIHDETITNVCERFSNVPSRTAPQDSVP
jgi:hypothetical protein